MAHADVQRAGHGDREIEDGGHSKKEEFARAANSAYREGIDGECEQSEYADAPLEREQRGEIEPLSVRVELAEDVGRHEGADALHIHQAIQVALRQQMIVRAERNQMTRERRDARELTGKRRQIDADRMHGEAKAVDAPENKERDGSDGGEAEQHARGVAAGPLPRCLPSGGQLSSSEQTQDGEDCYGGVLGCEGEPDDEAAEQGPLPAHRFDEAIEGIDRSKEAARSAHVRGDEGRVGEHGWIEDKERHRDQTRSGAEHLSSGKKEQQGQRERKDQDGHVDAEEQRVRAVMSAVLSDRCGRAARGRRSRTRT